MELGNMVFGNSRGNYSLPRSAGFEEELYRLFNAYAPERDNSWREYGIEFENNVFSVFPYYWGECECGYEEREYEWSEANNHEPQCYQTKLHGLIDKWVEEHPEPQAQMFNVEKETIKDDVFGEAEMFTFEPAASPSADMWRKWYDKKERFEDDLYDRLCAEFKLDRKFGCAVHCTCNYQARWAKFLEDDDHKSDCPTIKPNFLYKPTGFEIQWYKYPLRDSYSSQKIKLVDFRNVIDDCIKSLDNGNGV